MGAQRLRFATIAAPSVECERSRAGASLASSCAHGERVTQAARAAIFEPERAGMQLRTMGRRGIMEGWAGGWAGKQALRRRRGWGRVLAPPTRSQWNSRSHGHALLNTFTFRAHLYLVLCSALLLVLKDYTDTHVNMRWLFAGACLLVKTRKVRRLRRPAPRGPWSRGFHSRPRRSAACPHARILRASFPQHASLDVLGLSNGAHL
jgi:hypothetical protein